MKTAELNGLKVAYTDNGSGDRTIILMHGWGCNSSTLASVERVALAAGYRVINVDFPGFGLSAEPEDVWGVEEYTRVIEQLVGQLGIERPVLLGHSFGGRVGILYSSRNEVGKLILVDAAGVKPHRSLRYYIKVWSFKASKAIVTMVMGKEKATPIIDKMRAARGSSDYASASAQMRRILSKVVNEDLCSEMPKIKAPTLLIWGTDDKATPLSDARKMERLIPDAGLVEFAGCGHYSFLDNPGQFARVLTSFLNS
ncbi:MAG: alpha/beta hydrolase [Lachnoclostridium sp.]|nr:alpha/beta hydrolase [Lachnoclostridium sp.]